MSIFSRISDIISANINALLDRSEDPERMIAQIVREKRRILGVPSADFLLKRRDDLVGRQPVSGGHLGPLV